MMKLLFPCPSSFRRHGFGMLIFSNERVSVSLLSYCYLLREYLTKVGVPVTFLALVGRLVLLFSSSASFGQAFMIFAEPALECLILFKACYAVEGSGLRLETRNCLHDEAAGVSEVDVVGISEHAVGELEVATVDLLRTLASLN